MSVVSMVVLALLGGSLGVRPSAAVSGAEVASLAEQGGQNVPKEKTLENLFVRFTADEDSLRQKYDLSYSPADREQFAAYYRSVLGELKATSFEDLNHDGQVDYVLLRTITEGRLRNLETEAQAQASCAKLVPFSNTVVGLEQKRRTLEKTDWEATAVTLTALEKEVSAVQQGLGDGSKVDPLLAYRATQQLGSLSRTLDRWYGFYNGYDPLFTWWIPVPYKKLEATLAGYRSFLNEKVLHVKEGDPSILIGDPIGREAFTQELHNAMIDYTPEELLQIADKEYAWCEAEMKKASREMGFGDDWKKALDKVRADHVAPGEQPALIKGLADEAIKYVEDNDLVTVPAIAKDTWTMEMMSPQAQLRNPFFLGGPLIIVSYPTDAMDQGQKETSLRANNKHFARATVFHELIPGHRLQNYMESRFNPYRVNVQSNPFWIEGWAFYWEMLLYDRGFAKTPEDKIGMLWWRMHRCARIMFSVKFHLGQLTPEQCVDLLVEKVGHERGTAEGEVRRSLLGGYGPLYQLAYMVGALQFRQLHRDLVETGKMKDKAFHDAILHGNHMPIELVRASLTGQKLSRDYQTSWRFYPL